MSHFFLKSAKIALFFGLIIILGLVLVTKSKLASAGLLGSLGSNVQQIGLQPIFALDSKKIAGNGDISIVGNSALLPDSGPMGTVADIEEPTSDQISIYTVRSGDTLSEIAQMYDVSVNTVRWANDLTSKNVLKEGQVLIILPVSGIHHTVVKGETVESIAKKYQGDVKEIVQYNNLTEKTLAVGDVIIIPDGEEAVQTSTGIYVKPGKIRGSDAPSYTGYYIRPVGGNEGKNWVKTQGLHGYNGVDIASLGSLNIPILASASGQVIISKSVGWNGGYGKYVVIQHSNNTQTLYAHLNSQVVSVGQQVEQGQVIGNMGRTGNSSGVHVHFEIRGAKNPF